MDDQYLIGVYRFYGERFDTQRYRTTPFNGYELIRAYNLTDAEYIFNHLKKYDYHAVMIRVSLGDTIIHEYNIEQP